MGGRNEKPGLVEEGPAKERLKMMVMGAPEADQGLVEKLDWGTEKTAGKEGRRKNYGLEK